VSDDQTVVGSQFHDAGPVTANARSLKFIWNVEPGDLQCAAERSRERAA